MIIGILILIVGTVLFVALFHYHRSQNPKEEEILTSPQPEHHNELSRYPFLRPATEDELKTMPEKCHGVQYVYCEENDTHYVIQKAYIHSDEVKLSELRVKLYEQSRLSSSHPLLVCSCCRRPVYLTGNPGIKGQIVGFCHEGEGYNNSGIPADDYSQAPKPEDEAILEQMAMAFSSFKERLDHYVKEESFLAIPGTDKSKAGDVTFTYGQYKVAVIFISASHPLDFIIRRARNAKHRGCVPVWVVSKELIDNHGMSVRDISAFSGGYVCSIDEESVRLYRDSGEIALYARSIVNGSETYVSLLKYVEDSASHLPKILEDNPVKHRTTPKKAQKKEPVKESDGSLAKSKNITISDSKPSHKNEIPRSKINIAYSAVDYWAGRRFHIKGNLYVEKIGETFGVVNLETHRYPILPMYENIEVSEDKNTVITHLQGEEKTWQI